MELAKSAQNTVLRLWIELTKSVSYIYGKATLTRFEEIFEEYNIAKRLKKRYNVTKSREV